MKFCLCGEGADDGVVAADDDDGSELLLLLLLLLQRALGPLGASRGNSRDMLSAGRLIGCGYGANDGVEGGGWCVDTEGRRLYEGDGDAARDGGCRDAMLAARQKSRGRCRMKQNADIGGRMYPK